MPQKYEIEIKSLLGSEEKYKELKATIAQKYPKAQLLGTSNQLNHYFVGGKIDKLFANAVSHVDPADQEQFELIVTNGKNPSIRTRKINNRVLLIIKASIDSTTSSNGISRMEFEGETPFLTLEELDQIVLDAGYAYQSKWSRSREEYGIENATLCIDKNAGYGYIAELEIIANDPKEKNKHQKKLRTIFTNLDLKELPQDRLERMFDYYNKNWQEYYGTNNTFNIT